MIRNIKTAVEVIAGAEGYEVAECTISNIGSMPICDNDGKVIGSCSDAAQIIIILKNKKQCEVCDD